MPTELPRLQITMPQALYDAVSRLANLTHQSKARVILDVIEPALPFFQQVGDLLETASQLKKEPANQLAANLDLLQQQLAAQNGSPSPRALSLMVELFKEIEASESSGATAPHPSNTGGKIPNPPPSLPSSSSH